MLRLIFIIFVFTRLCSAVIYSINETEYKRMPPLYSLDDYGDCMRQPDGTYCITDYELFSRHESYLLRFIQEYSQDTLKHFNHTQIHRGVCLTTTCRKFINHKLNRTSDLGDILEACINETIWDNYKLETKLTSIQYCKRTDDVIVLETSDYVVAVIYIIIILLNVIGSSYDVILCGDNQKSGNRYLIAFSIFHNWKKLVAPSGVGPEPRLNRLKIFNGLRAMTMICVIFSHTVFVTAYSFVDNPLYIEKCYDDPFKQILLNGNLVVSTFFVMSAFLLAYNFQLHAEKHPVTWLQVPKGILLRWIRLTPIYALIIATISTWVRYLGDGPMWDMMVIREAVACRQYWWSHLLYINNYIYGNSLCVPQTWYLAADTQLFALGLVLCVLFRRPRSQKVALAILFLISMAIVAAHTYFQDLDAVVIQSPESYRDLYAENKTFRLLYVRGHTNLSSYVMGLAGGFLVYHWQKQGKTFNKKYRWILWLHFPLGVALILSGGLFYIDGVTPSALLKITYAVAYKPMFQILLVNLIISCIFEYESIYRGIVEWRGFTWLGRLSYSAFFLHTIFQRGLVGVNPTPWHMSDYSVIVMLTSSIFLSFMAATATWLLVEAPVAGLTKALMGGDTTQERGKRDIVNKTTL